jgi:hypothetical protein
MAFIQLNGIELEAQQGSGDEEEQEVGEGLTEAFDGSALRSVRGYKRRWSFTSLVDTPTNSRAFRKLLQSRVRNWTFDADLYSTGGLGPNLSGINAGVVSGGLFGNALQLNASTGHIEYDGLGGANGVDGFTLLILRKNGSNWDDWHLSWSASGTLSAVYLNGVAQATALPSWITSYTHATGALILNNTTGAAQLYDEMVAMAFEAPLSSWSAQLATWRAANAWGTVAGALQLGSSQLGSGTVFGKPSKAKMQAAVIGGQLYEFAESFPFELWEA